MIRTAICEDEAETRAYLAALIARQPFPCEIVEYASASGCLADSQGIDLLFLDIELDPSGGRPDGMALARQIRGRAAGTQPVLIFVTGYDRYVFDAFDVGAFQYLLKPVEEEKFARVFAQAVRQVYALRETQPKARVLTVRQGAVSRTVPLDTLYYMESSNHQVVLHTAEGEFACYARIRDLELELQDRFFRIHKGYLANLSHVRGYSKTEVLLANGEMLPLSKYKYQGFVKAYLRFLKGGMADG